MDIATEVRAAFEELRAALEEKLPEAARALRPPVPYDADWIDRPGAEELRALWSVTSGHADGMLGVAGGLRLLGPIDSEAERAKWRELFDRGEGFDAVAQPEWDASQSLDPDAVRGVYFAAGWIPVLCEPMEGNYLAVDLVPLERGRAGQVILCGRDEDDKCVVAPSLAAVLRALAAECRRGAWTLEKSESRDGKEHVYIERDGGRLLSACKDREFP